MAIDNPEKSWFETHPKKTIGFILLLVIGGLIYITEKILTYKTRGPGYRVGVKRYIKIKEHHPLSCEVVSPNATHLSVSDNLIQKPYLLRIDRDGFIMPSRIHEHPDLTMVFLGGSTTELAFAEEENRFPYLSGRLLERKLHVKVNSYNGAKSGNGSLHSIDILLNKVIPLKPDLVFLMHNVNDLTVLLYDQTNSYWTTNPYRSPLITEPPNLKTASRKIEEAFHIVRDLTIPNLSKELRNLAAMLRTSPVDEFAQVRGKKIHVNKPWLINEFKMNQQTFINICRARNITPVLMTMASRITDQPDRRIKSSIEEPTGLAYHEYKEMFDLFNQAIREVGGANHVMVIDLARAIPQEKQYLFDAVHFNDEGSKLAASIISERSAPLAASLKSIPAAGAF